MPIAAAAPVLRQKRDELLIVVLTLGQHLAFEIAFAVDHGSKEISLLAACLSRASFSANAEPSVWAEWISTASFW
ncbi:MAG: hypothetical protein ACI9G1_003159 [Pirellulaceae bacterium]|jgi:hypothetical protein